MIIGAIIGIFIECGTVPSIIYYGVEILSPKFFLPTTFLICSIMSYIIGSSWSTVGTIGIAILGIATSSDISIPIPIIAGAIVSGAWFGDKVSPVSDSTVMTSTAVANNIYSHIKSMLKTTIPTYIIVLIIYFIINISFDITPIEQNKLDEIKIALDNIYNISFINFIPLLTLIILSFFKVDAIFSLLVTIATAVFCGILSQNASLSSSLDAIMYGVNIQTDNNEIAYILNRGGIDSMLPTFLLCFFAISLGGILEKGGYLNVIMDRLITKVKSAFGLITMVMTTSILTTTLFADVYLPIILNANIYKKEFSKRNLNLSLLSRTIEDGTTLFVALVPWSSAAIFISTALGIAPGEYMKFSFLNILNPIITLVITFIGILIAKKNKNNK